MKEQNKALEKHLSEMEISNLLDNELKVIVIELLTWEKNGQHNENFNKQMENIKKYRTEVTEVKNAIIELKNTLGDSTEDQMKQKNRLATWKQGGRTHPNKATKQKK